MFKEIILKLKSENINNVVISNALSYTFVQQLFVDEGFNVSVFLDSRSGGYAATGMCLEMRKPVVLVTENDNDSRNCYSSLTEAYYKKLPIIFISIENNFSLEYGTELRDTVITTFFVDENNFFDSSIIDLCIEKSMPVHIVVKNVNQTNIKFKKIDSIVSEISQDDVYIYVSNSFKVNLCNNIKQNIAGGCDGLVSNVLGASLSGMFRKYVGISTDTEFLHDLNALGNRFMNDMVSFVVCEEGKNDIIADYAKNLGFSIYYGKENLSKSLENKKSIVLISVC